MSTTDTVEHIHCVIHKIAKHMYRVNFCQAFLDSTTGKDKETFHPALVRWNDETYRRMAVQAVHHYEQERHPHHCCEINDTFHEYPKKFYFMCDRDEEFTNTYFVMVDG